jgi:hypothetical protein
MHLRILRFWMHASFEWGELELPVRTPSVLSSLVYPILFYDLFSR